MAPMIDYINLLNHKKGTALNSFLRVYQVTGP